jgi:hypothetical protein
MTARWSGVFPESQRKRCASEEDLEGERKRSPQAPGGQSPKKVFLLRVLVTRNVGCRSELKHLGDALEECRKANKVLAAVRLQASSREP